MYNGLIKTVELEMQKMCLRPRSLINEITERHVVQKMESQQPCGKVCLRAGAVI